MSIESIDIILPYFRPHGNWLAEEVAALQTIRAFFAPLNIRVNLIAVNDGSPPEFFPAEALARLADVVDSFEFVNNRQNRGKGYALRCGAARANGDLQFYTDCDFPFGTNCIIDAYSKLTEGASVVMGVRDASYGRALTRARKAISAVVRGLNSALLGVPGENLDAQAGFKAFNAAGKAALLSTKVDTFMFDTEFILIACRRKLTIATVPLALREGLHFSRMGYKVIFRELRNLLGILWRVRLRGGGDQ